MKNYLTRAIGILLTIFGALQLISDQVKDIVSPTIYGWYTITVGVAMVTLGALKKGEGNFLVANKTWLIGIAITFLGAIQQYSDLFSELLGPNAFTTFNWVVGVGMTVLGYINSQLAAAEDKLLRV